MGILFYNKSSKKLSFEAFVSNGYLNITFDQENNNLGVNEYRMTFFLSDIQSYTTHSFLGKKPAFIEIFAIGQQYEYQSRPIYVENLSKEELAKFTNFLDGIITKVRRLNA
jgi:hypothetical protein